MNGLEYHATNSAETSTKLPPCCVNFKKKNNK